MVEGDLFVTFHALKLHPNLMKALSVCGFDQPTEIQKEAIPLVLEGHDLMASAQTGTGKTAAFVLPACQLLMTQKAPSGNGPRVLVLTPTRELAMQVDKAIADLSRFCRMYTGNVVGGMPYGPQLRMLSRPTDFLVATPGRLMDHMEQGRVHFNRVQMLILDEADRMLDMGFNEAVMSIAAATPKQRQTLLFSATLEGPIVKVAKKVLRDPKSIQLTSHSKRHELIEQRLHQADDAKHKQHLLNHYLTHDDLTKAVIFTATKRGADRLAKKLAEQGHTSAALHGDMTQNARKRTVERLRHGKVRLLVATDVAARGLDINGISHVINFDLPMSAEDYIHRIGRTGRGGSEGTAISLIGPDDWPRLSGIEKLTGRKLERQVIPGLEPSRPAPSLRTLPPRRKPAPRWKSAKHNNNRGRGKAQRGRENSNRT